MPSPLEIKKIVKRDPVMDTIVYTPPKLTGGIFYYGRIGSGKTTTMVSLAQSYHDDPRRKYKIFDLWGGERNEQYYWCLPSKDINYWKLAKRRLKLDSDGPKQYNVNLLFPVTRKLPMKLPFNPPHVFSKIFTIPFQDLEVEDFMLIRGNLSQTEEYLWRDVKQKLSKEDNGAMLDKVCGDLDVKGTIMYKNILKPLIYERLLQSQECELNLNLKQEMGNRDTISVLSLEFVDKEFRLFVMGYLLRKIRELLDNGKLRPGNIILIREASDFFRVMDSSIAEERRKVFKERLSNYIRMGRRGTHLFLDTQSPSETRGMVDGSQDLTILGKMPSELDRKDATDSLRRDQHMTSEQITQLSQLEPGEVFVVESGKRVVRRYFLLPRTMYWKEGFGSFFNNVWKNSLDKWFSIKEEKYKLEEIYKKELLEITERSKIQKVKKEKEKEIKKEEQERERLIREEERIKREIASREKKKVMVEKLKLEKAKTPTQNVKAPESQDEDIFEGEDFDG